MDTLGALMMHDGCIGSLSYMIYSSAACEDEVASSRNETTEVSMYH